MAASFFFYDLETSGVNPRSSRIMQFAGQRTTMDLEPIGEPVNELIRLTPDVVPEPDAILVTGITPQKTIQEGVTEAEFLRRFQDEIATRDTIFVGFNTVRFDDEFMRFALYRNFYDPYEWQWKDGRSRWDLLDVVRMTRALRPDDIEWPFDSSGKPSNRLELLTAVNGIDHQGAHDALVDVRASIALAKLLRDKQPKLFAYLLELRDKKSVAKLVEAGQPFVYSSGKYPAEYEKTTVALAIAPHPKKQGMLVFDLRHDPTVYAGKSAAELADAWRWKKDSTEQRLPVKVLQYNHCPAIAPLAVLDDASRARLQISLDDIKQHATALRAMADFPATLLDALAILDEQLQSSFLSDPKDVDAQLYDGFIHDHDKNLERAFRAASPDELAQLAEDFHDTRLRALAPLYKARNYPASLTDDERAAWDTHVKRVVVGGGEQSKLARYFKRLDQLATTDTLTPEQQYLLEELQLYGQSLLPSDLAE